ncbi:hypothetical protein GCM10011415_36740 [Salipiger pallidus]|uniref:Uncharacterized protein n=1 Tax=Salipiger pallidus TaxID=1775170 RepID=A0A8J2ZNB6_9RHOB|nr:hypothetical protein [Salipiger pallidus]GGG83473.1 hypothetical protein GCM10011415_36740 [Salipiger pallidus]
MNVSFWEVVPVGRVKPLCRRDNSLLEARPFFIRSVIGDVANMRDVQFEPENVVFGSCAHKATSRPDPGDAE